MEAISGRSKSWRSFRIGFLQSNGERDHAVRAGVRSATVSSGSRGGEESVFGGLVASGWHTAAITMRLLVTSNLNLAGGAIGLGVDEMRFPMPVRPGDTLRLELEIVDVRPSRSKPDRGTARIRYATRNQEQSRRRRGNPSFPRRQATCSESVTNSPQA